MAQSDKIDLVERNLFESNNLRGWNKSRFSRFAEFGSIIVPVEGATVLFCFNNLAASMMIWSILQKNRNRHKIIEKVKELGLHTEFYDCIIIAEYSISPKI